LDPAQRTDTTPARPAAQAAAAVPQAGPPGNPIFGTASWADTLTTITRLATRQEHARAWLAAALASRLEALAPVAIEVSVETGDPLGQVLAEALAGCASTGLLEKLAAQLDGPELNDSVPLREASLVVTRKLLKTRLAGGASPRSGPERVARARLFRNLGERLGALGDVRQALRATQSAVDLYREAARTRTRHAREELATTLLDLGMRWRDVDSQRRALAATQEGVDRLARLVQRSRHDLRPGLAAGWVDLAVLLSDTGREDEGLRASEAAVALFRILVAEEPAYRGRLGRSLLNAGQRLSRLGCLEDACAATAEAAEIFRSQAEGRRDLFEPDLAVSLHNLGLLQKELGELGLAHDTLTEAVAVKRHLARHRPSAFRTSLASCLNALGSLHLERRDATSALPLFGEAIALYRQDTGGPAAAAQVAELARTFSNQGLALTVLGRHRQAHTAAGEGLRLFRHLAARQPETYLPDLAAALCNVGAQYLAWKRPRAARDALREAVAIFQGLPAPLRVRHRASLARALVGLHAWTTPKSGTEP
jgi:tetratricopeptide (TPR) repeat protein